MLISQSTYSLRAKLNAYNQSDTDLQFRRELSDHYKISYIREAKLTCFINEPFHITKSIRSWACSPIFASPSVPKVILHKGILLPHKIWKKAAELCWPTKAPRWLLLVAIEERGEGGGRCFPWNVIRKPTGANHRHNICFMFYINDSLEKECINHTIRIFSYYQCIFASIEWLYE